MYDFFDKGLACDNIDRKGGEKVNGSSFEDG